MNRYYIANKLLDDKPDVSKRINNLMALGVLLEPVVEDDGIYFYCNIKTFNYITKHD